MGKGVPCGGGSAVRVLVIRVSVGLCHRKSRQNLMLPLLKKKKLKIMKKKYIVERICELCGKQTLSPFSRLGGAM